MRIRDIINNRILTVWASDHQTDNTFVRLDLTDSETLMEKYNFIPEGICLDPPYGNGYALVFKDTEGQTRWVHISNVVMNRWLEYLNLMPPEDIVWDEDVISKWVWYNKEG